MGLIRGLAGHGIDVTTIAAHLPFTPDFTLAEVPGDLEVHEVRLPSGLPARLENLRRPHGELGRSAFADRVRDLAAGADVVHLEQIEAAALGPALAARRPCAAHLHYRVLLDRDLGAPWRREFRQVLEFVRAERRTIRHVPWLVANSPRVADSLQRIAPAAEVVVAPLTLDPDAYTPGPAPDVPRAGLLGTAVWPPTARALAALTERLWPQIRPHVPESELVLAGRGTEGLRVTGAGIHVVGEVPSAVELLRSLTVLTYPVGRGSGMKVKVLEALALGVPVVTTTDGAEGIGTTDGVVVADDDARFVRATTALLRDPLERAERSVAARRHFDAVLSPAPATEPLADLYRRMAAFTSEGCVRGRR